MDRKVFLTGVLLVATGVYVGWQFCKPASQVRQGMSLVQEHIGALHKEIKDLSALEDGRAEDVDLSYQKVYGFFNRRAAFEGLKRSLEEQAPKPSPWEGIKQMDFKTVFYDVQGVDQILSVFRSLGQAGRLFPMDIVSFRQSGKNLEIKAVLYGK